MLPWFVCFFFFSSFSLFFRKGSAWLFFTCAPFSCCFLAAFFMVRFFRRVPAISCPLSELLNGEVKEEGGSGYWSWGGSRATHSTGWKIWGKKTHSQGSACSLAHSLVYSLTLLPLRGTFTAPLCERRSAQFVRFVYFLFTPTAHAQARLPLFLSPSLSPSFSLWLLQPDCISLFCLTFDVRSLARSLIRLLACPCVTFIIIPLRPLWVLFAAQRGSASTRHASS